MGSGSGSGSVKEWNMDPQANTSISESISCTSVKGVEQQTNKLKHCKFDHNREDIKKSQRKLDKNSII